MPHPAGAGVAGPGRVRAPAHRLAAGGGRPRRGHGVAPRGGGGALGGGAGGWVIQAPLETIDFLTSRPPNPDPPSSDPRCAVGPS